MSSAAPYYRSNLALVHHEGFGAHAEASAPGVVRLLALGARSSPTSTSAVAQVPGAGRTG